jgi:hypothetical protein
MTTAAELRLHHCDILITLGNAHGINDTARLTYCIMFNYMNTMMNVIATLRCVISTVCRGPHVKKRSKTFLLKTRCKIIIIIINSIRPYPDTK